MNARMLTGKLRHVRPDLVLQGVALLLVLVGFYAISTWNYLVFHGLIEITSIVIAFAIFAIVWNTRRTITNTFFLVLGISFLFTGGLDLLHMLAYKGMGVFPGITADLPTQLWIAARYFQGITFLAATLLIGKSLSKDRKYDSAMIFAACTAAFLLLLGSIAWHVFPPCFVEGAGLTPFKVTSEYVISAVLVASILVLISRRQAFERSVWHLLVVAVVFLIAGELAFTSYVSVYGFMNMLGHLFKLLSVYFFYRAIVVVAITRPYDLLFYDVMQKETALRESEARYAMTLDAVNDGLWDWHVPTGEAFFSNNYYALLGYFPDEFPASYAGWRERVHPDDLGPVETELATHIRTDTGFAIELRMKTKAGEWRWVQTRGMVVERGSDGTAIRMVGTLSDISGRKQAELALQQANQKLHLLSSITRHDILNQLTALRGYLELSEAHITDPVARGFLDKEQRIAETIERQITFTRDYQEMGIQAPAWQEIGALVREAVAALPVRQVRVEVACEGIEVYADPLLSKVFYNLVDNALRYGGPGLSTIRFLSGETGDGLMLTCEDDGAGISEEDKKRLFTRGFGKNTGLGLFLSREILAITGITITETGVAGKGARFEMLVPKGAYRFRNQGP